MMAEGTRRGIELFQERINNVARFTALWEYRFGLRGDPSQPDIDQWRATTLSISYEIERRRLEVDQRLSALRTMVLELDRLRNRPTPIELTELCDGQFGLIEAFESLLPLQR